MTERIAVVRALQLGDMLVALPALRALRGCFPHAEITLIGLPWACWFADRFSMYVDQFVEFPGWPGIAEAPYEPEKTAAFLREQQAYGYDLAIQMHGSGEITNAFVFALGADRSAGFYAGERPAQLWPATPYPDDLPEVLRLLHIAELFGAGNPDPSLEFPVTEDDRAELSGLLPLQATGTPLRVGLHPGASAPSRRWPEDRFADVANRLVDRFGAQIILTGGPDEIEIAEMVAVQIEAPVTNLAGQTSLGGLAALLSGLNLFVTNDTGPSHIANAIGTPSVTIFGPADVRRWAPLDTERHRVVRHLVECNPCFHRVCPIDHRCMLGIAVDDVWSAVEDQLMRAKVA